MNGREVGYGFAQCTVHLIISLYILLGNNLQRYKAFTSDRNDLQLYINIVGAANAESYRIQDRKFSFLVSVRVVKQRFGNANFYGREMILIGQFFAGGSPEGGGGAFCRKKATEKLATFKTLSLPLGAMYVNQTPQIR